jgi:hypothetical protein
MNPRPTHAPGDHPFRTWLLLAGVLACGAVRAQESVPEKVENSVLHVVHVAASGVEHGAHAAVHGVQRGAEATAHGVEVGASAVARAAKATARKVAPASGAGH